MTKLIIRLTFIIILSFTLNAQAQDVHEFIKQGIELNNAHNYAGAIDKYKAALAIEPANSTANYQLAFSLNAQGKGQEALPYLQKVAQTETSASVLSNTYQLMGSIYDHLAQPQEAVKSYQQGIRIDSSNYALHYGLGLAYFRNHQYAEAEQSAVTAMGIDPTQSGSMRLYALVTFHQDKRAPALLGFCSFLAMEPNGARTAEAYTNIQHILQGGQLKLQAGTPAPSHISANTAALNQALEQAAKSKGPGAAQFAEQLQSIFTVVGQLTEKQIYTDRFFKQLASYYYKMLQTAQVPVFARFINQSVDKSSAVWLNAHPQQLAALAEWIKANQ